MQILASVALRTGRLETSPMTIEIPELGDDHHGMWADLVELAAAYPNRWTLIGAHMVALYAWDAGLQARPSDDADVLVNVRIAANATEDVSRFLIDRGYEPEISANGIAHLFQRDGAAIDV